MAAPTKGNTTSANPTPAASFYQFNHNQNAGSNRLLVAQFTMYNVRSFSSCTYGGQSMTQLYQINRGGLSQRMVFFYLQDPPTGNNTLRVNFNNSVFNPISIHARSFTDCGGIGNSVRTGGLSTPNTQNLVVSQDSFIMITSCAINVILTQQIPTGTNRTFITHNTNRQVTTGAISSNTGENAGTISLRATAAYGTVTLDRTEIKGLTGGVDSSSDFFAVM